MSKTNFPLRGAVDLVPWDAGSTFSCQVIFQKAMILYVLCLSNVATESSSIGFEILKDMLSWSPVCGLCGWKHLASLTFRLMDMNEAIVPGSRAGTAVRLLC